MRLDRTNNQDSALRALKRLGPGHTSGEVAEATALSPKQALVALQRLLKRGLITKNPNGGWSPA